MTTFYRFLAIATASLTVLSACATSDDSPSRSETVAALVDDPRTGEEVERICFARGIDSFNNENRYSVVLRRGVDDEYLVVTRSCPDLEDARSLAIPGGSGCLRRFDRFEVYVSAFGPSVADTPGFTECIIDRIYRWDDEAEMAEETDNTDA